MRYTFYECPTHGRLQSTSYFRYDVLEYRCNQCNDVAILKEIIVCKHHGELPDSLITTKKTCRICHRKTASRNRNNNRKEFNLKQALDRELNPDKWALTYKRAYSKLRHNKGSDLSLYKVCATRGITIEYYQYMINKQSNKCAICNKVETCIDGRSKDKKPRRLSIDHCHQTGKVRGLLCHSCNTAIGKFKDDVELLRKAMEYISQYTI